jgi:hypothetical protein
MIWEEFRCYIFYLLDFSSGYKLYVSNKKVNTQEWFIRTLKFKSMRKWGKKSMRIVRSTFVLVVMFQMVMLPYSGEGRSVPFSSHPY